MSTGAESSRSIVRGSVIITPACPVLPPASRCLDAARADPAATDACGTAGQNATTLCKTCGERPEFPVRIVSRPGSSPGQAVHCLAGGAGPDERRDLVLPQPVEER